MNNTFSPYIYKSFEEVLEKLTGGKQLVEQHEPAAGLCPASEIAVVLGIKGDLEGRMSFSMTRECAADLAGKLLRRRQAGIGPEAKSAISEMCNMICAALVRVLSSTGRACDITTPSFFDSGNTLPEPNDNSKNFPCWIRTDSGLIHVNVSLKSAAKRN